MYTPNEGGQSSLLSTTSDNDAEDFDPNKDIIIDGGPPIPKSEWSSRAAEYANNVMAVNWGIIITLGAFTGWDEALIFEKLGLSKFGAKMLGAGTAKVIDKVTEEMQKKIWNAYFNLAWTAMAQGHRVGSPPPPQWGPDGPDDGPD